MLTDTLASLSSTLGYSDIEFIRDMVYSDNLDIAREYEDRVVNGTDLVKVGTLSAGIYYVHPGFVTRKFGDNNVSLYLLTDTPVWTEQQVPVGEHRNFFEIDMNTREIKFPVFINSPQEIYGSMPESDYIEFYLTGINQDGNQE